MPFVHTLLYHLSERYRRQAATPISQHQADVFVAVNHVPPGFGHARHHQRRIAYTLSAVRRRRSQRLRDGDDKRWKILGVHIVPAAAIVSCLQLVYFIGIASLTIFMYSTDTLQANCVAMRNLIQGRPNSDWAHDDSLPAGNKQPILTSIDSGLLQVPCSETKLIREMAWPVGYHVVLQLLVLYGLKIKRRWYLIVHLCYSFLVLWTKLIETFKQLLRAIESPDYPDAANDFHNQNMQMVLRLLAWTVIFIVPFRAFHYLGKNYTDSGRLRAYSSARTFSGRSVISHHRRAHSDTELDLEAGASGLHINPHYAVPPIYSCDPPPPAYDEVTRQAKLDENDNSARVECSARSALLVLPRSSSMKDQPTTSTTARKSSL